MTDLLYSDVEEELRASVRSLLAARAGFEAVLARIESPEPVDLKLWRALAVDLGVAGLPVPEAEGGAGASWRETAVVMEELGRSVAPVPFLGSSVLAVAALLGTGDPLLDAVAAGSRVATLAVPLSASAAVVSVTADGDRLDGTVTSVVDAGFAEVLLVPTAAGLYAVEAADAERVPVVSFDLTRPLTDVTLRGVTGRLVSADATAPVERALRAGAALLASEQLGVAEWCLTTTVDYVKTRRQFARQVGSYQAIKHRLADLWVSVTQARAVARYAADCLATGDADLPVAAALAQAFCSPVAVKAAEECVQLHGGIGFTWEHPAHLYLKRARSNAVTFGSASAHRAALADLVAIPS
ncbi:acyl-CoA/acyl-ACP dehydrogenase [Dactylosporangium sp. NBC_01737]|uniref:acyl-CoA dehydrogenase family protein n=1 Tax=Dactylosporangium sp. NBC_01737 TaxID=2975959 RepID=UPI002E0FFE9A|nr:acyl-CoA/acyl-ACP dehydrogenase [Dactylosporangium sp. NBC_01737]